MLRRAMNRMVARSAKRRSALAVGSALGVHLALGLALVLGWPARRSLPVELVTETAAVSLAPSAAPHAAGRSGGGHGRLLRARGQKSSVARVRREATAAASTVEAQAIDGNVGTGAAVIAGTGAGLGSATGAGTGVGSATGSGTGAGVGAGGGDERTSLVGLIKQRIAARRYYPELARRRGVEGTVGVSFYIEPDGRVSRLSIRRSADPALDEAAADAVRTAAPLPHVDGALDVDLDYRLGALN